MTMDRVRNAGHEFRIADGIYIFHWYRHDSPYNHSKVVMSQLSEIHFNSLRLNK